MNTNTVRKYKLFFSWQDEQEQAWLGEMSRKGLHLKRPGSFGRYKFEEGPGRDITYRMDYNNEKAQEDYLQLIKDAGWEYLGTRGGWYYWRKVILNGVVPEIFSDPASKIQKYQRLLAGYTIATTPVAALYIIGLAGFKNNPGLHPAWFVVLYIVLFMSWIVFASVNAFMIWRRINELKQRTSA
jgi:hypothetical protein